MAGGLPLGWGAALGRSTPILDSCPPSGYAVGNHSCTPTVGPLAYLADYEVRAISYPQRPSGGLSFPLRREPNASGMGVSGRGRLGSARSLHSRAASTATNSADLAAQRSWAEPLVIFVVVVPLPRDSTSVSSNPIGAHMREWAMPENACQALWVPGTKLSAPSTTSVVVSLRVAALVSSPRANAVSLIRPSHLSRRCSSFEALHSSRKSCAYQRRRWRTRPHQRPSTALGA